ncbi:AAA family ATPase [Sphingomonas sp. PAMC 26621]|uniref:AAA family ATPase n=1 Tax=Sphingomonas sp. PAMC 26621 TaxID=1112213 RepID=UPI000289CAD0|nr:AAA family ATPase [Sphingomonas sp. PAMC 26621]
MIDPSSHKPLASLLERAAALYDLDAHRRARTSGTGAAPGIVDAESAPTAPSRMRPPMASGPVASIDRALLAEHGLLVPGAPIGPLAEEFRLVKRHLLATARSLRAESQAFARTILVTSANPDDGKTYCALNLAISLAAERDVEVLLIDADFAKPDVMKRVGLAEGPGLLDALADPTIDPEGCIVRTDIAQLSLLPCGTKSHADTELVASARTEQVLAALLAADTRRIVIFDSPPVLAASPAALIAGRVGQVVLVVRADRTGESDLRDAVALLDDCEQVQLLLNAVAYAPGGRRYGSYYAQQDDA